MNENIVYKVEGTTARLQTYSAVQASDRKFWRYKFAGQYLAALQAGPNGGGDYDAEARFSVSAADALLAELERVK